MADNGECEECHNVAQSHSDRFAADSLMKYWLKEVSGLCIYFRQQNGMS